MLRSTYGARCGLLPRSSSVAVAAGHGALCGLRCGLTCMSASYISTLTQKVLPSGGVRLFSLPKRAVVARDATAGRCCCDDEEDDNLGKEVWEAMTWRHSHSIAYAETRDPTFRYVFKVMSDDLANGALPVVESFTFPYIDTPTRAASAIRTQLDIDRDSDLPLKLWGRVELVGTPVPSADGSGGLTWAVVGLRSWFEAMDVKLGDHVIATVELDANDPGATAALRLRVVHTSGMAAEVRRPLQRYLARHLTRGRPRRNSSSQSSPGSSAPGASPAKAAEVGYGGQQQPLRLHCARPAFWVYRYRATGWVHQWMGVELKGRRGLIALHASGSRLLPPRCSLHSCHAPRRLTCHDRCYATLEWPLPTRPPYACSSRPAQHRPRLRSRPPHRR